MVFEPIKTESIIQAGAQWKMVLTSATQIETNIGGQWRHDANDSDKPIKLS